MRGKEAVRLPTKEQDNQDDKEQNQKDPPEQKQNYQPQELRDDWGEKIESENNGAINQDAGRASGRAIGWA